MFASLSLTTSRAPTSGLLGGQVFECSNIKTYSRKLRVTIVSQGAIDGSGTIDTPIRFFFLHRNESESPRNGERRRDQRVNTGDGRGG